MGYLGPSPSDEALKIGDDVILSSHINDGVIVNADINASAAIAMSKTTLVGGTGLTLSTNTLSVDASQTQITSLGTIGTGVWQGTKVASAYLDDDTAHLSGTQTFSGAKTFTADIQITEAHPQIGFTDSDDNSDSRIYHSAGSLYIDADNNNEVGSSKIRFSVDDSEVLNMTTSGATFAGDLTISNSIPLIYMNDTSGAKNNQIFFQANGTSYFRIGTDITTNDGTAILQITDGGGSNERFSINSSGNASFAGTINTTGVSFNSTGQNFIFNSEYAMYFNTDSPGGTAERFVFGSGRTGITGGTEWLKITNSQALFTLTGGGGAVAVFKDATANANVLIQTTVANKNSILNFGDADSTEIGQIDYDHDGNSMKFVTDGTAALTLDSSQNATFAKDIQRYASGGSAVTVSKTFQKTGTYSGDVEVVCTSNGWKSFIYDLVVIGHGGGGHWRGFAYHNSGISHGYQSISNNNGGVSAMGLTTSGQSMTFTVPLSSVTHILVEFRLSSGAGDLITTDEIAITID